MLSLKSAAYFSYVDVYKRQLQELIRRELADCREYQTLSRRAGGGPARVLAGLALSLIHI